MIEETLSEILSQASNPENAHLSVYVKRLLDVMEFGIPYTTAEILKKLNLKSRETLRKNYLNPAIKMDLIKMTLPDKPTSRNQRYIKK